MRVQGCLGVKRRVLLLEGRGHWEGRGGQQYSGGTSRTARKTWPERLHLKTKNRPPSASNQRPSHAPPTETPNDEHRHSKQPLPLLIPTTHPPYPPYPHDLLHDLINPACAPCYLALYTPLTAPSPRRLRSLWRESFVSTSLAQAYRSFHCSQDPGAHPMMP